MHRDVTPDRRKRSRVNQARTVARSPSATKGRTRKGNPMGTEHVEYHSVPKIVITRDGPEERRIAFVDDFGGTMQLSTQQLRNLITLLVSDEFWTITGL